MRSQLNNEPQIIMLSMRLYGWLLRLGPKEFRQAYEEEILKDFFRCCHQAYSCTGICGVLQLWPSLFTKAIIDMSAEHFSIYRQLTCSLRKGLLAEVFFKFLVLFVFGLVGSLVLVLIGAITGGIVGIIIGGASGVLVGLILEGMGISGGMGMGIEFGVKIGIVIGITAGSLEALISLYLEFKRNKRMSRRSFH